MLKKHPLETDIVVGMSQQVNGMRNKAVLSFLSWCTELKNRTQIKMRLRSTYYYRSDYH